MSLLLYYKKCDFKYFNLKNIKKYFVSFIRFEYSQFN